MLSLLALGFVWHGAAGAPGPASLPIGGPFTLTTNDGKIVSDTTYRGKWLIVYFGYTACPDACPTALTDIGVALKDLGPRAGKVQALFVTLDPAHDTLATLREYMSAFDPRIVALRGTSEQIESAATRYHVYYKVRDLGDGAYTVDHSSFLYVMRPDGTFAQLLGGDTPGHELGAAMRRLIN